MTQKGLISSILGTVPNEPRIALAIWANKPPQPNLRILIALARELAPHNTCVFVDDLCPRIVHPRRTDLQQIRLNKLYSQFFSSYGSEVSFSSVIYQRSHEERFLSSLMALASKVTINEFRHILPPSKKTAFPAICLKDLFHFLLHLRFLDSISKICDTLAVFDDKIKIAALHRKTNESPLAAILFKKQAAKHIFSSFRTNLR